MGISCYVCMCMRRCPTPVQHSTISKVYQPASQAIKQEGSACRSKPSTGTLYEVYLIESQATRLCGCHPRSCQAERIDGNVLCRSAPVSCPARDPSVGPGGTLFHTIPAADSFPPPTFFTKVKPLVSAKIIVAHQLLGLVNALQPHKSIFLLHRVRSQHGWLDVRYGRYMTALCTQKCG